MRLEFRIYGEAIPQGSAKAFTPRGWRRPIITSDNVRLKSWRQLVAEGAQVALLKLQPAERVLAIGGVRLTVAFYLPRPQSLPKKITAHTKKPDVDKLVRAVCDALTSIVYSDDRQVCELVAVKQYAPPGKQPRVDVLVEDTAGLVPVVFDAAPLLALAREA